MPSSLLRISNNILNSDFQDRKNFIFLLDYSKSMSVGGKIENSIKCILKIWDDYIMPNDNVCFIKYNLNVYVDFALQAKKLNEHSKRF